jgi:hypothetical protein
VGANHEEITLDVQQTSTQLVVIADEGEHHTEEGVQLIHISISLNP